MHNINKISLGAIAENGMKYKIVETTAGDFETRCSAYNQTVEQIGSILQKSTGKSLTGPPIKIWTFMYDRIFKPRQKFLFIKQLTESRTSGKKFYGVDIFNHEIDFMKKKCAGSDKVILMNYAMPLKHWAVFDKEDVLSMAIVAAKAGLPHVTVPLAPAWGAESCFGVINRLKGELEQNQTYLAQIHPHMDLDELRKFTNSLIQDEKCRGVIMAGRTPLEAHNALAYRRVSSVLPDNMLFVVADVEDTFGGFKLPTQIALRMMNADLTCRIVKPYLSGNVFAHQRERSMTNLGIYVDEVAAILNDHEQQQWTGKSMTEVLHNHFSLREGVNFAELAIAYNFSLLNKTSALERQMIDNKSHSQYIFDRIHLSAFMEAIQKVSA